MECLDYDLRALGKLPETNSLHLLIGHPKRNFILQPLEFSGLLLMEEIRRSPVEFGTLSMFIPLFARF